MSTKLKQRLRGSTAPYEPKKKPKKPKSGQLTNSPKASHPPTVAEIAVTAARRTRQRRGMLRKVSNLRGEPPPERFLTWADLFECGIISSKTQARRMWERGDFPPPVHLSERVIAFRESEVIAWAEARKSKWAA